MGKLLDVIWGLISIVLPFVKTKGQRVIEAQDEVGQAIGKLKDDKTDTTSIEHLLK